MLLPLLIGTLTIFVNMLVQVLAAVALLRFFVKRGGRCIQTATILDDVLVLCFALIVLFAANMAQCVLWALLFVFLGEFQDVATAFYHSTVNFSSLGYGDIVMSEQWRLLGALEAANGVLMFGLTAGTMFAVMQNMVRQLQPANNSVQNNSAQNSL